jgi:hypothetical protein
VKDLPDIELLAGVREIEANRLRSALNQTFTSRRTHDLATVLPPPPSEWADPYARIAQEDELKWADLGTLVLAVEAFLNPVLAERTTGMWSPAA